MQCDFLTSYLTLATPKSGYGTLIHSPGKGMKQQPNKEGNNGSIPANSRYCAHVHR